MMLRRPPGEGRRVSQQRKYLLALAFCLLPWLQVVDAQQQLQQQKQQHVGSPVEGDQVIHNLVTVDAPAAIENPPIRRKRTVTGDSKYPFLENKPGLSRHTKSDDILIPNDASALALAPEKSVRAPDSQRPRSSAGGGGDPSRQTARSLENWEVEDFVLLATVDGDLYASDRKTGKERWHLEVEQPMVETKHFRVNNSVLDDDYSPVDHFIWAVEPNRDGELYLWNPGDNGEAGLVRMGLTMKKMVEDLAPFYHKVTLTRQSQALWI
jgi:serine/threonine-protein kinase/endoribonuclease IRE1